MAQPCQIRCWGLGRLVTRRRIDRTGSIERSNLAATSQGAGRGIGGATGNFVANPPGFLHYVVRRRETPVMELKVADSFTEFVREAEPRLKHETSRR